MSKWNYLFIKLSK